MPLDVRTLDLPTLAWLAGDSANRYLLAEVHRRGHEHLRISHGYVFQHLIEGEPTVGELAEALGVTQQASSKIVSELEGFGYVERVTDPADNRIRRVRLTSLGRRAIRDARAARRSLERRLTRRAGNADAEVARQFLATLVELTGGGPDAARRRIRPPR